MRYGIGRTLLAALALSVGLTTPAYAATSAMTVSQADILEAHNDERVAVGVVSLQWSSSLQESAQRWAEHLAAIHELQHSGPGENIWSGTKGFFSDTQKVGSWTAEKEYFLPHQKFPNVSSTGRWQDVGHYTQVIWYNTETSDAVKPAMPALTTSSASTNHQATSAGNTPLGTREVGLLGGGWVAGCRGRQRSDGPCSQSDRSACVYHLLA